MNRRRIMTLAVGFFLALVLSELSALLGVPALRAQEINVGVLVPMSGKLAKYGEMEKRSYLLAANEINVSGGIHGAKIRLFIKDTAGKPEVGRSAIKRLISQQQAIVVVGGHSSPVSWEASAVAQDQKVPFLITTASADKIMELGRDHIFRLAPPVSEHGKALLSFLKEIARPKTAAILCENTYYGEIESRKFWRLCRDSGVRVIMKGRYEENAFDFKPLLVKVHSKNPDLLYMISYGLDAAMIMRQARELGLGIKLFLGGTAAFTKSDFRESAGNASQYVISPTLWSRSVPYPGAKEYFDKFVSKFGSPPDYHGAQAYAGLYVIADALARAQHLTAEGVREALANTETRTAYGPVKFVSYAKKSQQNKAPVLLAQWIEGKLEIIWPRAVATSKAVYPAPSLRQY